VESSDVEERERPGDHHEHGHERASFPEVQEAECIDIDLHHDGRRLERKTGEWDDLIE
jgi:hypothetical protein